MESLRAMESLHRVCRATNLWHWRLAPPPDADGLLLRRSRWLELYGWCVILVAASFTGYGLFQEKNMAAEEEAKRDTAISSIGRTVDFIQLVGMRVAHVTALLEAIWQRRVQREFFVELGEIDRQLAKEMHTDVTGARAMLKQEIDRQAVWTLWGYAVSQSLILGAKLLAPDHSFPLYWLCYLLPLLVCGVRYFQIFAAVQMVRWRLETLITTMQHLQLKLKNAYGRDQEDIATMQRLVSVRLVYHRIWALLALLNQCFGLSMLLLVGNDFLAITSNCYWMFLNFRQAAASIFDVLTILASAVWSAPHLGNVLVLSLLCDRTAQCATRLAMALHQVSVDLRNDSHNALITQFSLQLLHQRLHFSAAGFFNVDCTLLYTIVGATTTYLIILIQFHMSADGEYESDGVAQGNVD